MPEAQKILIVENDDWQRRLLWDAMTKAGYRVLEAEGVRAALAQLRAHEPDLVILDVKLDDGEGMEVCRDVRAHKTRFATPVIMLTSSAAFEAKAAGFKAGADQYLVKPVPPEELLLWCQALLRRASFGQEADGPLKAGELSVDVKSHAVEFRGEVVSDLTRKELELLYFLVRKRPKVVTRREVLSQLWHTIAVEKVVDFHIGNLRRKLPQAVADKIQAVPGRGFRYFE